MNDVYLHPYEWIDGMDNEAKRNGIKEILDTSFENVDKFVYGIYEKYLLMYWENMRIDYSLFTNELLSDPNDSIQYSMEVLVNQKEIMEKDLPFMFDKELLRVNTREIKKHLMPFPVNSLNRLYADLPVYISKISGELNEYLNENIASLSMPTTNVADFVKQMETLKKVDKKIGKLKEKSALIGQLVYIIDNNKGNIILTDKDMIKRVKAYQTQLVINLTNLDSVMSKVEQNSERHMIRFAEQVSKSLIPNLNKEINSMETLVSDQKFLTEDIKLDQAIQELEAYDATVRRLEEDSEKYGQYERTLRIVESKFENLEYLREGLNLRLGMWRGLRDWMSLTDKWMNMKFEEIDVDEIKQTSEKYVRIVKNCSKLPPNPILEKLRDLLKTFKDTMPVVMALSNKILQEDEEYWGEIERIVGRQFKIDSEFTLKNLI